MAVSLTQRVSESVRRSQIVATPAILSSINKNTASHLRWDAIVVVSIIYLLLCLQLKLRIARILLRVDASVWLTFVVQQ